MTVSHKTVRGTNPRAAEGPPSPGTALTGMNRRGARIRYHYRWGAASRSGLSDLSYAVLNRPAVLQSYRDLPIAFSNSALGTAPTT
jgi:hypothetical protein